MQIDEWVFGLTKKETVENAFVWAGPLSRMIRLIRFVTIRDDQTWTHAYSVLARKRHKIICLSNQNNLYFLSLTLYFFLTFRFVFILTVAHMHI